MNRIIFYFYYKSIMQGAYIRNIHQIVKKSKLAKIERVLSILLIALIRNSKSTNEDSLQPRNRHIEKDFKPTELAIHSIIKGTDCLKKESYADNKKYFTLIKDISFTCGYTAQLSDIFVIEEEILNRLSTDSRLTCSYTSDDNDNNNSNHKNDGSVMNACSTQNKRIKQARKEVLIVPYTVLSNPNYLGRFEYVRNTYLQGSELATQTESAIACIRSIFIRILCKAYIECASLKSDEKYKMACFIEFLKENGITKRKYLEAIGMKGTFFYELVGRLDDFHFSKSTSSLYRFALLRREKRITEAFESNSTLWKMAHENMFNIENTYENSSMIITSLLEEEEHKYRNCSLNDLVENTAKDTVMFIDTVCNGKFHGLYPTTVEELKVELEKVGGYKEEGRIIIEVLSSMNADADGYIYAAGIDSAVEREIDRRNNKGIYRINKAFIKEHINQFLRIDTDIMQRNAFGWDKRLLELLTDRLQYDHSNKSLEEVQEDYRKIRNSIINEIKGKRRELYTEFKRLSPLQTIHNEKIKNIIDKIHQSYYKIGYSKKIVGIVDDRIEREIINLLSCITVDYSAQTPDSIEIEAEKNKNITLREKYEQIASKEASEGIELEENRHRRIEEEERRIYHTLKEIEKEFLIYNELDETDKVARIKERRKNIFILDINEQLIACGRNDIADALQHIKDIADLFSDILLAKKITYSNPASTAMAQEMLIEANKHIEGKSIEDMRNMLYFLKQFEYGCWNEVGFSPCFWSVKDASKCCSYSVTVYSVRQSLANTHDQIDAWIDQNRLSEIYNILQPLYSMTNGFARISSYEQVWENPIFLSIRPVNNNGHIERKGYITYMLENSNSIYEKEIELTDKNLQAFQEAKTVEEIDKIGGRVVKKTIPLNEYH